MNHQPVSACGAVPDERAGAQDSRAENACGGTRCRRRLRRQAVPLWRGGGRHLGREARRPPGEMGGGPLGGVRLGPAWPGSRHRGRAGVGRARKIPRAEGRHIGQYGRLPLDFRPEHPDKPVWPVVERRLHDAGDLLQREGGLHQHGSGRRLSRRRPTGSDVRGRAPGGRSRRGNGH